MTTKDKIDEIFFKVNTNDTFRNAFYDKLSTTNNPKPWLGEIVARDLFYPFKKEHYVGCLNFLLNYSKNINVIDDDVYAYNLLDALKPYLNEPTISDKEINKYYVDYMIVKILFTLPEKYYDDTFILFINNSLASNTDKILISAEIEKTVVPKLIEYQKSDMLLSLMEIISEPILVDVVGFNELFPVVDDFWFSELVKKRREEIIELCGSKLYDVIYGQISKALEKDKYRYNIVTVPSIEFSDQIQFPDKYECLMTYLLRDVLLTTKFTNLKATVSKLLISEHSIFKRIGIHVVDSRYDALCKLLWSIDTNLLLDIDIKHELYVLYNNNSTNFTDVQIQKILGWIKEYEIYIESKLMKEAEPERDIQSIIAISVKEWLFPLLKSKNRSLQEEYYKYDEINPETVDHPGWSVWSSGLISLGPKETELYDFKDLTDDEVVNELNKEVFSNDPMIDYYENEAIGGFKKEIELHYPRYLKNPVIFSTLHIEYQNALFSKIYDLVKRNLIPDLENFIDYVEYLIKAPNFWNSSNTYLSPNIVNQKISDIFSALIRDENNVITSSQFDRIEDLFIQLANVTNSDLIDHGDSVTSVLNSALGNFYSTMIVISLRRAKESRDSDNRWTIKIKDHFDKLIKQPTRTVELQVTLGKYLQNLYYLDKTWVTSNLEKIFTTTPTQMQLCFGSYLFFSNKLFIELYQLLLSKGYYDLSLSWDFDKDVMYNRIVQHACVSYLNDIETGTNLFLNKIIDTDRLNLLSTLVWFIWHIRDSLDSNMKEKVIILWESLYNILNNPTKYDTHKSIIARLSYWLSIADRIDEKIVEWCIFSSSLLELGDEMFFIEYLLLHVDTYPKEIAEIMWGMMKDGFTPRYKEEDIAILVRKIFESGQKEIGMKISYQFLKNNMFFIKPILAEYSQFSY